jgi:hypothetical protein
MPRKSKEETSPRTARKTPKTRVNVKSSEKPKAGKTLRTTAKPAVTKEASTKKSGALSRKSTTREKKSPLAQPQETSVLAPKKGARSRLPRFGQTQLVAFVRDPNCIFTYWEVTPETVEEVRRQLMDEYEGSSMVLRVLRSNPDGTSELLEEILVNQGEMNRYVNLEEAGGSYVLEIGHKAPSGRFVVLARTNPIQTGAQPVSAEPGETHPEGWEMPEEIRDYFGDETIENSFEPGKKFFSADLAGHAALHRRRLGPQDRHAASRF